MQNIFKNKYLDQKKLVKDHFYYLVSNFSELNQKQIDNLSINIVKNAQSHKAGSPFSKLIHEFSLTSNEGIVLMCLAEALLRIPDAKTINDLNKHRFISFGKGAPSPVYNPDWALKLGIKDGKKRKSIMKVNSVMGLLLAVETGVGLAALPEYLVTNSTNVIKVLPSSEGPITEAHFVYPQSLKNTARITAFRNFLFSKIGDWKS